MVIRAKLFFNIVAVIHLVTKYRIPNDTISCNLASKSLFLGNSSPATGHPDYLPFVLVCWHSFIRLIFQFSIRFNHHQFLQIILVDYQAAQTRKCAEEDGAGDTFLITHLEGRLIHRLAVVWHEASIYR